MNANSDGTGSGGVARGAIRGLMWVSTAVLVGSWLLTAIAQLQSMSFVNHVSGAWIALSYWASQGVYYPALEFDGNFAGTRFGPLSIALQALAYRLTGDAVVGGKLLHVGYMIGLVAGLWILLRPLKLPAYLRVWLATAVLATSIGWTAGLTIRHDAFATMLQVWALALLCYGGRVTYRGVVIAGVLAALAPLAKVSALWGVAACFLYLLAMNPKRLLLFLGVWFGTLVVGLGLVQWFSDGRFYENMRGCLFVSDGVVGGMSFDLLLQSGSHFWRALKVEPVLWLTLPLSVAGVWYGRRHTPHLAIACVMVWLMSAYLYTRSGIWPNHLIDLVAICTVGTGMLLSKVGMPAGDGTGDARRGYGRACVFVLYALVFAGFIFYVSPMSTHARWGKARLGHIRASLEALVGMEVVPTARETVLTQLKPGERVVSLYPMVPVLLDQDPIVLDAWMLRVYFETHPDSEAAFIQRVEAKEFDAFVFGLGVGPELEESPWHFGQPTLDAIRRNYRLDDVGAYTVFRPIRDE